MYQHNRNLGEYHLAAANAAAPFLLLLFLPLLTATEATARARTTKKV